TNMTTMRKAVLILALLTLSAATSFAYVTLGRRSLTVATMRLSDGSFPAASPELNAVIAATNKWNLNPSNFRFSLLFNDTSVSPGNGQSEIWFTPGLGFPSVTYPVFDIFGNLAEADIVFDEDKC